MSSYLRGILVGAFGIVLAGSAAIGTAPGDTQTPPPAQAAPPAPAAPAASADVAADQRIGQLYRDVERAEALRAVKYLQVTYQQYAQYGLWNEMAALFSDTAEAIYGDDVVRGREAIGKYLVTKFGGGRQGLPAGALHNQILIGPVVTLSYDGRAARGRWSEITMRGRTGGPAEWDGGIEENEYVLENGRWKIARLRYYKQFAGPYETGWLSLTPALPLVPFHYTPSTAGRPVPDQPGDFVKSPSPISLAEIDQRITALNDEDTVRNLQNVYGYYIDRKMWDDVTDLFTEDGVLEIAGVGVYDGVKSIRRALERHGPAGLQPGQVHDHLQLATVVSIEPGGAEARARGLELGMLTPAQGEAYWSVGTFLNRYAKMNGVWRIREMRIFPKMKTDYYKGWAKSAIVGPPPAAAHAPDRPTPPADSLEGGLAVPAFFQAHPSTGQPVAVPAGLRVVGEQRLLAAPAAVAAPSGTATPTPGPPAPGPPTAATLNARLAEARRRLDRSKGWDAVENITNSLSYYMDDELWQEWTDTMSKEGWRVQGPGWFVGRDRLYKAMVQGHTTPSSLANPREAIRIHQRAQPVIDVSPDARSAKIRTRMWLYFATPKIPGAWNSGMYPSDAAVLEDGVWRMDVNLIDETYFNSPSYADGWARPGPGQGRNSGAPATATPPASGAVRGRAGGPSGWRRGRVRPGARRGRARRNRVRPRDRDGA